MSGRIAGSGNKGIQYSDRAYESGSEDGEIRECHVQTDRPRSLSKGEPNATLQQSDPRIKADKPGLSSNPEFQKDLDNLIQWGKDSARNKQDLEALRNGTTGLQGEELQTFRKNVLIEQMRIKKF